MLLVLLVEDVVVVMVEGVVVVMVVVRRINHLGIGGQRRNYTGRVHHGVQDVGFDPSEVFG